MRKDKIILCNQILLEEDYYILCPKMARNVRIAIELENNTVGV